MSNTKTTKAAPAPTKAGAEGPIPSNAQTPAIDAKAVKGEPAKRLLSASPVSPSYKSYADKGIGLNFGQHPALIDDCLDRSIVSMQVVTGSGNMVLAESDPQAVLHPSIVGVNPAVATGAYQVTVSIPSESSTWVVTVSVGVSWSVLILKQKAKQ